MQILSLYLHESLVLQYYTGSINIVGLSFHADIKIVSVNGTLVNQGKSVGHQHIAPALHDEELELYVDDQR